MRPPPRSQTGLKMSFRIAEGDGGDAALADVKIEYATLSAWNSSTLRSLTELSSLAT